MHVRFKPFNTCNEPQITHKDFCDSLTTGVTEQHMQKGGMADAMLSKDKKNEYNDLSCLKNTLKRNQSAFRYILVGISSVSTPVISDYTIQ